MSLILLLVGLGVLGYGRLSFGDINAEGPTVRAAGFILIMPFISTLFLGEIMQMLFGDASGIGTALGIIELIAMVVCVGIAYTMIFNTAKEQGTGATIINLPQFGRNRTDANDQSTAEADKDQPQSTINMQDVNTKPTSSVEQASPKPADKPRPVPAPKRTRNGRNYPNVMSTSEAASYLEISEPDLMKLIEQGKIAAARINYRYRISRAVLDEFISDQGPTLAD